MARFMLSGRVGHHDVRRVGQLAGGESLAEAAGRARRRRRARRARVGTSRRHARQSRRIAQPDVTPWTRRRCRRPSTQRPSARSAPRSSLPKAPGSAPERRATPSWCVPRPRWRRSGCGLRDRPGASVRAAEGGPRQWPRADGRACGLAAQIMRLTADDGAFPATKLAICPAGTGHPRTARDGCGGLRERW